MEDGNRGWDLEDIVGDSLSDQFRDMTSMPSTLNARELIIKVRR
jgi:hypothetical protein